MDCRHSESLGRLIYLTAQEIKNFAEKQLKPYDLTLEQFHLLKHLSHDTGLNQREIGEAVNKTPANLTRILDRLEQKDLVVRRHNARDRRSSLVFLTLQGQSLVQEVFAVFESFSTQLTRGTSEEERETAKTILHRIEDNIKNISLAPDLTTK